MKTLAVTLHTGKSQQIVSQRRGRHSDGMTTTLASSLPGAAAAAAITHFTTLLQVQLPLQQEQPRLPQEQFLLPQEQLLLQEPRPRPLLLLPLLHPPRLLAWPLDVSLGCQGTPPAHRPHWRRQKHRNPHSISPR